MSIIFQDICKWNLLFYRSGWRNEQIHRLFRGRTIITQEGQKAMTGVLARKRFVDLCTHTHTHATCIATYTCKVKAFFQAHWDVDVSDALKLQLCCGGDLVLDYDWGSPFFFFFFFFLCSIEAEIRKMLPAVIFVPPIVLVVGLNPFTKTWPRFTLEASLFEFELPLTWRLYLPANFPLVISAVHLINTAAPLWSIIVTKWVQYFLNLFLIIMRNVFEFFSWVVLGIYKCFLFHYL